MKTEDTTPSGLKFQRTGNGSNAVLFVHGFLDDRTVWDDVIENLQTDAEVIQCDLAGMGKRLDVQGPLTLARLAAEVGEIADTVNKPLVIVGQSMGAQIAEMVAARRLAIVSGLVLVTPVPLGGVSLPDAAIEPFRSLGGHPDAHLAVRQQLTAGLAPERLKQLTAIGLPVRAEVVRDTADAWNAGDPSGKTASAFKKRVLVINGAQDGFVTEALLKQGVLPRFDDVQVETIDGAGHWPHFEQPRKVAAALARFLQQVDGSSRVDVDAPPAAVRKQGWTQAFAEKSADTFADAFDPDVYLEASVMTRPVEGREQVKAVMSVASKVYEQLAFTHEAVNGNRNYLEWEARAFGGKHLSGVTVLTKNDAGKIVAVAIHHRPLEAALRFSQTLRAGLAGVVDADHFHSA